MKMDKHEKGTKEEVHKLNTLLGHHFKKEKVFKPLSTEDNNKGTDKQANNKMTNNRVAVSKEYYVEFSRKRIKWQAYKARIEIIAAKKGWEKPDILQQDKKDEKKAEKAAIEQMLYAYNRTREPRRSRRV